MARKDEFVRELATQVQSLKDWYDALGAEIAQHTTALDELTAKRRGLLTDHVVRILPDLSTATVARLHRQFPTVIGTENVERCLQQERDTLQRQLDVVRNVTNGYTPGIEDDLRSELETEEPLVTAARESYEGLPGIEGLKQLLAASYDTRAYRPSWLNRQYYRDWKRADEIVDQLGLGNWTDVRHQFETRKEVFEIMQNKLEKIARDLAEVQTNRRRLAELTQALEGVPATVLEKFQVKLCAELENGNDLPENIGRTDRRIAKDEEALTGLREQREKVSEKITRLEGLRTKVVQSRRQDVPDEYLRHVRRENRTSQQTVYVERHDDWLSNYLYYNMMFNMFNQPAGSSSHNHDHTQGQSSAPSYQRPGDHYGSS